MHLRCGFGFNFLPIQLEILRTSLSRLPNVAIFRTSVTYSPVLRCLVCCKNSLSHIYAENVPGFYLPYHDQLEMYGRECMRNS